MHFGHWWDFYHNVGALDGKLVTIRCPRQSGSKYYNYKGFYSVVMLALVDVDYRFLWANVWSNGCCSDAQIFNDCQQSLEDGTTGFSSADLLPGDDRDMPYFTVADDTFVLRTWLKKPFSGRNLNDQQWIFNCRLFRARWVVENAFGILANCFRCLLTIMAREPNNVMLVVLACVALHNIIRTCYWEDHQGLLDEDGNDHRQMPGGWRQGQVLPDVGDQNMATMLQLLP